MPDHGIAPGQVLDGRYRIERRLGKGGVGQVYLGRHQRTGRPCAIKLLIPEGGLDQSSLRRFEREARTLGSLGHPGIVGIHDFSETPEGVPYLVMDYLDGEDLAQRLSRDGAMSWETTRPLFREMAHALHAAHCHGVLHRDLKPGNVYLARTPGAPNRAVLLDFGLAKAEAGEKEELSLTRTGAVFGTPLYMSPEQARGARLDHRSDIYSLGTILFEMLAGKPPYVGVSLTQLVSKLLLDPVPVLSEAAAEDLPAHLDGVLGIALGKAPEERYPSVIAFAEAVLEEPLAEAWAQPVDSIPETLAATIPSEPPPRAASGDTASPDARRTPVGATPSTPSAGWQGAEPRSDESLANQVTLASGEAPKAREVVAAGAGLAPRRGATSFMLHIGIFLLGMAAATTAFWLILRRGAAPNPSSETPSKTAAASRASGRAMEPGPRAASVAPDAATGRATDAALVVDAGASSPRAGLPSAEPPMEAPVPSPASPPLPMTPRRPGVSQAGPVPRASPTRVAPEPTATAAVPAGAPPGAPPLLNSSFGQKLYAAGQLRGKALTTERQGKGRECLSLLDQADRMHPETAPTYHYLRGWCLMHAGRCADGRKLLVTYYKTLGISELSSQGTIQWAENAKCPATTGSPAQQLVRVHQRITTACGMYVVDSCRRYVRLLEGLAAKLPRPFTSEQTTLVHQGFVRAGVCMGKAKLCDEAWRYFQSAAAVYLGSSPQAESQAAQHMRAYAKGCPTQTGGP